MINTKNPNVIIVGEEAIESSEEELDEFYQEKGVFIHGEDPETDIETDLPLEKHVGVKSVPIRSDGRSSSILPAVVGSPFKALSSSLFQYHIKRNKSLEHRVKSLVEPILIQHSNQIEKASQNLSNIQMEIQESLLHTRIVTANLLRLQMDLTQFTNRSHLQGLKRSGGT